MRFRYLFSDKPESELELQNGNVFCKKQFAWPQFLKFQAGFRGRIYACEIIWVILKVTWQVTRGVGKFACRTWSIWVEGGHTGFSWGVHCSVGSSLARQPGVVKTSGSSYGQERS